MSPVIRGHLPFMIVGPILACLVLILPKQGKTTRRLAFTLVVLAVLYVLVVFLGVQILRQYDSDGFGTCLLAFLWGLLMGLIAGGIFLAWLGFYLVDLLTGPGRSVPGGMEPAIDDGPESSSDDGPATSGADILDRLVSADPQRTEDPRR